MGKELWPSHLYPNGLQGSEALLHLCQALGAVPLGNQGPAVEHRSVGLPGRYPLLGCEGNGGLGMLLGGVCLPAELVEEGTMDQGFNQGVWVCPLAGARQRLQIPLEGLVW